VIIESAVDRILRILALAVGIGSAVFMVLGLPSILAQQPHLLPAYSITVYVVFFGLPLLLIALSSRASIRAIKTVASVHALSTLIFLALWLPSVINEYIPGDPEPWLMLVVTVGACTAALVLPYIPAWAFLLIIAGTSGVVRFLGYRSHDASVAFQDAIFIALFSGVMVSLIQLALRAGHEQDLASAAAQRAAVDATAAEVLERQRTRYHAFTHDDVLATLNSAARGAPGTEEVVRTSALQALEKMDEFRIDGPSHPTLSVTELEHLMRAAAAGTGIEIDPARRGKGADTLQIPADVADAIVEAMSEALRNSVHHADWPDGRPVHRYVRSAFSSVGIEVIVSDDGRGFAARRVGLDRLGVRLSILQRVNSQPGGIATVRSARGHGTTVTLTWSADGAAE
jgi:two-component sensor histidine kinase